MGVEKVNRPLLGASGFLIPVETVTLSSALQTLAGEGVSLVTYGTSGVANDAQIPSPHYAGQQMTVVLDNNTTSLEASFYTHSTGQTFWGTTFNTITINSTANETSAFSLIAATTARWAVVSLTANLSTAAASVDWALSASTGSTGQ